MKISRQDAKSNPELNPSGLNRSSGSSQLAGVGSIKTGSASGQPSSQAALSDHVQLSNLSSSLSSSLDSSPARLAKVSELNAAVSSGQYQVDAYAVSGSIIQHSIQSGGYMAMNP